MGSPSWRIEFLRHGLHMVGIKEFVPGSTGDSGIAASARVVELLRLGYPTLMTPDGPAGPAKTLRKGVLHMAASSGAPIYAVNFEPAHPVPLGERWDSMWCPRPFSLIRVTFGAPITVTADSIDEAAEALKAKLG